MAFDNFACSGAPHVIITELLEHPEYANPLQPPIQPRGRMATTDVNLVVLVVEFVQFLFNARLDVLVADVVDERSQRRVTPPVLLDVARQPRSTVHTQPVPSPTVVDGPGTVDVT